MKIRQRRPVAAATLSFCALALISAQAGPAMADGGGGSHSPWSPSGFQGGVSGEDTGSGLQVVVAPHRAQVGQPVVVLASLFNSSLPTSGAGAQSSSETSNSSSGTSNSSSGTTAPSFQVDFGAGGSSVAMTVVASGSVVTFAMATSTYSTAGRYQVTVTATEPGGSTLSQTALVEVGSGPVRLDGSTRYGTAVALSQQAFPKSGSAQAVVLATGADPEDALAAAPFAVEVHAPVLLTDPKSLPSAVAAELVRVLPKGDVVYILGGGEAISSGVASQVTGLGYTVQRLWGPTGPATALAVANALVKASSSPPTTVMVVSERDWPDALALAAWAANVGAPVLLTPPDQLYPGVASFLQDMTAKPDVILAGGPGVLSGAVATQLSALASSVHRVAGQDRFSTAVDIAKAGFPKPTSVVLATGEDWPDGLAGAAEAARFGGPVLLVERDHLPSVVVAYLTALKGQVKDVYSLGGHAAVAAGVVSQADSILGVSPPQASSGSTPSTSNGSGISVGG